MRANWNQRIERSTGRKAECNVSVNGFGLSGGANTPCDCPAVRDGVIGLTKQRTGFGREAVVGVGIERAAKVLLGILSGAFIAKEIDTGHIIKLA